jgi:uncharacterized protein YkwD
VEGDIVYINVETSLTTDDECEEETVQFQEIVSVDTEDLAPGTYLIASGVVERFEIEEAQPAEDAEEEEEGAPPQDATSTEEESAATGTDECEDYAVFLADVTYPDNTDVEAGETFTKTWEIRNDGTCTWGSGYELVFASGEFEEAVSLADPYPEVEPTGNVELSVVVTAPGTAGVHSGAWVIQRPDGDKVRIREGENFDLWAIVVVPDGSVSVIVSETRVLKDGMVCAQANPDYDDEILQKINEAREDNGLPAYELQSQLTSAAWMLTNDMACNDFVDHTGSDGSDWYDRISAEGYNATNSGENIFFSFAGVPEIAFNWWMDSSIHRGNILSSEFTQIGIAYGLNPQTGGSYYTLVFAVPAPDE